MKRTVRLMMFLCLPAAAACAGNTHSTPAPTNGNGEPVALLASVPTADGRSVDFYEVQPGLIITTESGVAGVDRPVLSAEQAHKPASELFAALAPAGTAVPAALQAAELRAQARVSAVPADAAKPAGLDEQPGAGQGPAFYDAGEQQWFANTYCNGAQACAQGWDWANIKANRKIQSGSAVGWVGSEGTQNAALDTYDVQCHSSLPFGLGTTTCSWVDLYHQVIVPGHWVSVQSNNYDNYFQWSLTGAGGGTQVSLAARF